jgi:hypothetical protein
MEIVDCGVAGCALAHGHRGRHMDAPDVAFNQREDKRMESVTRAEKDDERLVQRLTALIKTAPQFSQHNYTSAKDAAEWIVAEAGRLGWSVTIEEK